MDKYESTHAHICPYMGANIPLENEFPLNYSLTCFTWLSCGSPLLFWSWKATGSNELKIHHHTLKKKMCIKRQRLKNVWPHFVAQAQTASRQGKTVCLFILESFNFKCFRSLTRCISMEVCFMTFLNFMYTAAIKVQLAVASTAAAATAAPGNVSLLRQQTLSKAARWRRTGTTCGIGYLIVWQTPSSKNTYIPYSLIVLLNFAAGIFFWAYLNHSPKPWATLRLRVALESRGRESNRWPFSHRTKDCTPHTQGMSFYVVLNSMYHCCFIKLQKLHFTTNKAFWMA